MKVFAKKAWEITFAWLKKLLAVASQAVNALLLNGRANETVSSRAHSQSDGSKAWRITERVLDLVFWFDKDHCANSFMKEHN
jgi:hypothetical protein